jgi:hypothetical protein
MAELHPYTNLVKATVEEFFHVNSHEIEKILGGPTSGPKKRCWECGGTGHTRREHWRFCNRLRKEKLEKEREQKKKGGKETIEESAPEISSRKEACQSLDSCNETKHNEYENLAVNIAVQQGGGDCVCQCGVFECDRVQCRSNKEQYDSLFVLRNGSTQDLLRFHASINLGRETIAKQKALVDCGASTNFISKELFERIYATGPRGYTLEQGGWMQVTAAGWQSGRQRRRRITIRVEIGSSYVQELEFTVFSGLKSTGYDLVLGKPWLRLHNRRHEIDYNTNEMWIDSSDGKRHHLVGLRPEAEEKEAQAKALGLNTIRWKEACILRQRDQGVQFFMARAERIVIKSNCEAVS